MSREEAHAAEEDFHARLRAKIAALGGLYSPLDGKTHPVDPTSRPVEWDEKDKVKRLLVDSGILDRAVRKEMPANRRTRVDVGFRGLLTGFTPMVSVVGVSLSPLAELAEKGRSATPVGFAELSEAVRAVADRLKVFHYVGVMAPTGFTEDCRLNPVREKNLLTVLIERGPGTAWRTMGTEGFPAPGVDALFDLETIPEKIARCKKGIEERKDLRLRGGHVPLADLKASLGFPEAIFEKALGEVVLASKELQIREFDGIKILQRSRF
ncbi:MAG: hypothetical protein MUC63_03110 [Planctomycetes bacterium]|nr:hypothetical protein [Planctomycetota bacterium]